MQVHERLLQIVEARNINQTALAGSLGHSQQWLNERLLGNTKIKVHELEAIAEKLDLHPCDLYEPRQAVTNGLPPVHVAVDQMVASYQGLLSAMGVPSEDSDVVIAVAEFLRQRRIQRKDGGGHD